MAAIWESGLVYTTLHLDSMRSHVLLRLVGGKNCESRCVLRPACVWKTWFWLLILLPAFLQVWNLPIVSVPWGIWSHWDLSLWNLEMWLCWNDEGDWWRGVLFFHFRVSPRVSPEIRELSCLVLPSLVLSLLLLLLLVLLVLLLLLLLLTFPLPSCVRHKGHTQQSSLAGRSGWQQPCVLEANGQRSPCRAWEQGDALMRLLSTCQSWPGLHLGREPIGLRLCLAREACLFVWTASVLAPFGWSLRFDCNCGETCVPLRFSTKSFKIT